MTKQHGGFPRRGRGRQSLESESIYQKQLKDFCEEITEIDSGLDFKVSSRGWAYILENHGRITKGDFDAAQRLINQCRKDGLLPLDICSEDDGRHAENVEDIDNETPTEFAESWVAHLYRAHHHFTPCSFWDDLDIYLEMTVEKVDLKSLFAPVCEPFRIAITNVSGWNDINSRAAIMRRFAHWESKGKRCVLLHCGDHDPGGLQIADFLRSNMADLARAVGWGPDNLTIERFGLNADFIEQHGLTWIENLETSSGGRLDDPRHPDHRKSYVQSYLRQYGARKVEANALVVRPQAGRDLCRRAILRHLPRTAIVQYERKLDGFRELARAEIARVLEQMR